MIPAIVTTAVMTFSLSMFAAGGLLVGGLCGLLLRGLTLRRGLSYGVAVAGAMTMTWWTVAFTPHDGFGDWTWYGTLVITFALCWQWSRAARPIRTL